MNVSSETQLAITQLLQFCLAEAAPGKPFNARVATTPQEGQGDMAIIAPQDGASPETLGRQFIRSRQKDLRAAVLVMDATLTSPEGHPHDAVMVEIYERSEPKGYRLAMLYRFEGNQVSSQGRFQFMGELEQLLV